MAELGEDLTGQLLIAMPGMSDPRFDQSVILLCAHSAEGAMGLIVNKPSSEVRFSDLLDQLSIPGDLDSHALPVHIGGPVEHGRGFVLHSDDYSSEGSTIMPLDGFGMTATLDILEDIASGTGPQRAILALGYAGWGPGQLEDEIAANGWLTCDTTAELVFGTPDDKKWSAALNSIGVNAAVLSPTSGRA